MSGKGSMTVKEAGKKGGEQKSPSKTKSAERNGAKGGQPTHKKG